MGNLLSRDSFREGVFKRDKHLCVVCKSPAVDAHHLLDRKLFSDGGYYLDNGVSLCSACHIEAENGNITPQELREFAGINCMILPEGYDSNLSYDKWGKSFPEYVKYPRTFHLPWSEKCSDDDKKLIDTTHFDRCEVVVSIKMDGENTTLYSDKNHARSLDSKNHPSRNWVKGLWASIAHEIPKGWRICGENLYAEHTIPYNNLASYFQVISIWDREWCMSWDETVEWCKLFDLETVPVFYRGIFDPYAIKKAFPEEYNGDPTEGYVIRKADGFEYDRFDLSVAKFVSNKFVISSNEHWMQKKVVPNKLKL